MGLVSCRLDRFISLVELFLLMYRDEEARQGQPVELASLALKDPR